MIHKKQLYDAWRMRLSAWILRHDLTFKEVADEIGAAPNQIFYWIKGETLARGDYVLALDELMRTGLTVRRKPCQGRRQIRSAHV